MDESLSTDLDETIRDWTELASEYDGLQHLFKQYELKLEEMISLQKKVLAGVKHQRYRIKAVENMISNADVTDAEAEDKAKLQEAIVARKTQIAKMEESLPRPSGRYLHIILGAINVSIMDKKARFDYKDQYEQFKLIVNIVGFVISCVSLYANFRPLELSFLFLVVWYYCTLTIRESILKVNGSRIRGWWRAHHFISTMAAGVVLIWPDGPHWQLFRLQFMLFAVYVTFLQYLQFTYQRGALYRVKSLGDKGAHAMDITIDGFHTWMWKGLGFLLPFLFVGHLFQLYNSYTLYHLAFEPGRAPWQVAFLSVLFLVLGLGNLITTSWTIPSKILERKQGLMHLRLATKLTDKFVWRRAKTDDKSKSEETEAAGVKKDE